VASREDLLRPRRRSRLSPEERREQLSQAAIRVAARLGLFRTVHARVAQEADVSLTTVFKYFPTREQLLTAIVLAVGQFYEALAEQSHKPDVDLHSRVLTHIRAYIASIDSHHDHLLVWLEWSASARNEVGLWDLYLAHHARVLGCIRRTLDELLPEVPDDQRDDLARIGHALAYPIAHLKLTGASDALIMRLVRTQAPSNPGANLARIFE
jgi:TetR/AcrR family hemagglutinin/protease transcriptional regulator